MNTLHFFTSIHTTWKMFVPVKTKLWNTLTTKCKADSYTEQLKMFTGKPFREITDWDVVDILAYKDVDNSSRTIAHQKDCPNIGTKRKLMCPKACFRFNENRNHYQIKTGTRRVKSIYTYTWGCTIQAEQ